MIELTKKLESNLIEAFRRPTDDFLKGRYPWLEFKKGGRRIVIDKIEDVKEVPVDILRSWMSEIGKATLYILFTMGKFNSDTISYALSQREHESEIILIPLGLDENCKKKIEPLIYDFSSHRNTSLLSAFKRSGISFQYAHCYACEKRITVVCAGCGNLLCKDHFINCAICKKHFCHPDILDKKCYYIHNCR